MKIIKAPNISSIRILKGDEGQFLREEHWRAVKLLRDELTQHQIEYKKPDRASHVTTVELGSAKMADHVMGEMNRRGYYVQGRGSFFLVHYLLSIIFSDKTPYSTNGRRNASSDCISGSS